MSTDVALLVFYLCLALGVSFACSIFEAVLLSITPGYVASLEKAGSKSAKRITKLKKEIDRPLSAILSLNTIAHTVGAAGVGAQSAIVFKSVPIAATSGVLTVLILLLSEIIPKSLGAMHWKRLAPIVAALLVPVTWLMTVTLFVPISRGITSLLGGGGHGTNPSPDEISAIAEQGARAGIFQQGESRVLKNLFRLKELRATDIMTPRTVLFGLPESTRIADVFNGEVQFRFSRIPIYMQTIDEVTGYVLKSDVLLEAARDRMDTTLASLRREMLRIPEDISLSDAMERLLQEQAHVALVVDQYGGTNGLVTLEDVVETLFGMEIVDEVDAVADMRELARAQWKRRAEKMGIAVSGDDAVSPTGEAPTAEG